MLGRIKKLLYSMRPKSKARAVLTPEDRQTAVDWLQSQLKALLERYARQSTSEEVLAKMQLELGYILDEWYNTWPDIEMTPGVQLCSLTLRFHDSNILVWIPHYSLRTPLWSTQFSDLIALGQYEGYDLYKHHAWVLAFYDHNKYLVCSELSGHQTALEMFLKGQRFSSELETMIKKICGTEKLL